MRWEVPTGVCHTAERMDAKTKPYRPFLEQKIGATAIGLSEEDRITGIATQPDVVKGTVLGLRGIG